MQHSMKLFEGPFDRIKSGKKIIELRLFDKKRQKLKIDDTIKFSKLPELKEKIKVKILELSKFSSFKELYKSIDIKDLGFLKDYSIEELLERIHKIYSKKDEEKYGVLGIKIKLIK